MPLISKNKFFSNSIFGVFGQLVTLTSQLLAVPFFIHYWGKEIYGEWIFFMTIPPYFSLLDLGMGNVISNELTQAATNHTFGVYRKILRKYFFWQLKIVLGALLIFLIGIFFFSNLGLLQYGMSNSINFWILLGVYGLCTLGETLAFYLFRSLNQSDVIQFLWNMLRLLELVLIISVLKSTGDAKLLLSAMLVLKLSGLIIIYTSFFVKNPETLFGPTNNLEFSIQNNLVKGIQYSFFPASNHLLNGGTIWIINYSLGPAPTVIFSTLRTLVNLLRQIAEIIKQSLWPKISANFYLKNTGEMHKAFVSGYWLTVVITLLFASLIWFGESYIFKFWLGREWETDSVLFLYLLFSTLFLVQWQICSVVLESTNKFDKFAKVQLIAHLSFLLLTFLVVRIWELHGVAILLVFLHFSLCMYALNELKNFFSISSISKLLSFHSFSWKILFGKL